MKRHLTKTDMRRFLIGLALLLMLAPGTIAQKADPANTSGELWQFRDYTTQRISSYDTAGANDDGNWKDKIKPGETRAIGNVTAAGTSFW